MRIALAQLNTTAGDVPGNVNLIRAAFARARAQRADVLVLPELTVLGYPPRDLLLRPGVLRATQEATTALAREFAQGPAVIVGTVGENPSPVGKPVLNAAAFLAEGRVQALYGKRLLPTYDVFDEQRYFAPGEGPVVVAYRGRRIGLLICEDLWRADRIRGRQLYEADPPAETVAAGADLLVSLSASPYHTGKDAHRTQLLADEARRVKCPLVSVHLVGGNDDVLFDGRSRVFDAQGRECVRLRGFESDFHVVDLDALEPIAPEPRVSVVVDAAEELRRALVMGISDYCRKTGFHRVMVGLSGGVDSAVVACLAADAVGPENVLAVGMPGPFTAEMSRSDARTLCSARGLRFEEVPIQAPYDAFRASLAPLFKGRPFDVTEENLQARARGVVLMALSNKLGHMVLATGNKSELSVGYCTLYGDMNGGLAVLSDVWKTRVYELGRLYGGEGWIPARILDRPPSAELRPNQTDQDSLPPYAVLDRILALRIEEGASLAEIVARGEDPAIVERVLRMVERNEYKRRQLAPGLKVTPWAFGVGWRMPIARPMDLRGES